MTALEFATKAHEGQFRRDGVTPYIEHPKQVASAFEEDSFYYEIALLHDVLEDTDTTEAELLKHFDGFTVDILRTLTHGKNEPYEEYINRVMWDTVAVRVKLADIAANLADAPTPRQIVKYTNALRQMAAGIEFGRF